MYTVIYKTLPLRWLLTEQLVIRRCFPLFWNISFDYWSTIVNEVLNTEVAYWIQNIDRTTILNQKMVVSSIIFII